ncbi:MAG: TrkH family potassium uptake protein [Christensenellales bacterium]
MKFPRIRLNSLQLLAIGFAAIILCGAGLLSLPAANRSGAALPFPEALFTSTSATCVTGFLLHDTWTQFAPLGQFVILVLIQIGGLGFMTVAVLISLILGKRIGLKERSYLKEAVSSFHIGGVVRLSRRILIITALMELCGAALLAVRFVPMLGLRRGAWYAIFHSVSAFCSAGFDLMGIVHPYGSISVFASDPLFLGTVLALTLVSGLGFIVWSDILDQGLRFSKYQLHTRIILVSTLALTALSALALFFSERGASMAGMDVGDRLLSSVFLAATPRTMGFTTLDMASLSEMGSAVVMLNMLIGAGPGSTAGGLKLSTVVVILMSLFAYTRGFEDVNIWRRRMPREIERRAHCGAMLYLCMATAGLLALLAFNEISLHDALFDAISALGTVGLTRGATRALSGGSQIVLMLLMFAGRLGSLSVAMALSERRHTNALRNPVEQIIVG